MLKLFRTGRSHMAVLTGMDAVLSPSRVQHFCLGLCIYNSELITGLKTGF